MSKIKELFSSVSDKELEILTNFEKLLQEELDKLPFTKHLDDGQYNDGMITGFELGARWLLSYFE